MVQSYYRSLHVKTKLTMGGGVEREREKGEGGRERANWEMEWALKC